MIHRIHIFVTYDSWACSLCIYNRVLFSLDTIQYVLYDIENYGCKKKKNMLCTIRLLLETDDRANMKTKIKQKWSKWKYYKVKS